MRVTLQRSKLQMLNEMWLKVPEQPLNRPQSEGSFFLSTLLQSVGVQKYESADIKLTNLWFGVQKSQVIVLMAILCLKEISWGFVLQINQKGSFHSCGWRRRINIVKKKHFPDTKYVNQINNSELLPANKCLMRVVRHAAQNDRPTKGFMLSTQTALSLTVPCHASQVLFVLN